MAIEGTSDNTTGVFAEEEGSLSNTTGVLTPRLDARSPEDTKEIDKFDAAEEYYSKRSEQARRDEAFRAAYNHGERTWGDLFTNIGKGAAEIPMYIPRMATALAKKGLGYQAVATSLVTDSPYTALNEFMINVDKVMTNNQMALKNDQVAKATTFGILGTESQQAVADVQESLQAPYNEGLRDPGWVSPVAYFAGNVVGLSPYAAMGAKLVPHLFGKIPAIGEIFAEKTGAHKLIEQVVGKAAAQETITTAVKGMRAWETEGLRWAHHLSKPVTKILGKTAAQRGSVAFIHAALDHVTNVAETAVRWAGEGVGFEIAHTAGKNLINYATGDKVESLEDVASDLYMAALFGGVMGAGFKAIHIAGGLVRATPNKISLVLRTRKGKGREELQIIDKPGMTEQGSNIGTATMSTGDENAQSPVKAVWKKFTEKIQSDPVKVKKIKKALAETNIQLTKLVRGREGLYTRLKQFTTQEWKEVPAAPYQRFVRHVEDLKHNEEDGADKYSWWSTFLKKNGLKLPATGPHAKLVKYHKEQHLPLAKETRALHDEIHKPLETHAAERETIQKIEESQRYKNLADKNKKLLKERIKQLGEHGEEHKLTKTLREIEVASKEIEDLGNHNKAWQNTLDPSEFTNQDEINARKYADGIKNIRPEEIGKTPKETFEAKVPEEDKTTEKRIEEFEPGVNLTKEEAAEAEKKYKEIENVEHNHKSISDLYKKVAKCIIGEG
jgi:hypothetical protein